MHGFGAVAVGIEEEASVVLVAVFRPRAGSAVVAVARFRSHPPERVHELARSGAETHVKLPRDRVIAVGSRKREPSLPDGVLVVVAAPVDADLPQHGVVERL